MIYLLIPLGLQTICPMDLHPALHAQTNPQFFFLLFVHQTLLSSFSTEFPASQFADLSSSVLFVVNSKAQFPSNGVVDVGACSTTPPSPSVYPSYIRTSSDRSSSPLDSRGGRFEAHKSHCILTAGLEPQCIDTVGRLEGAGWGVVRQSIEPQERE